MDYLFHQTSAFTVRVPDSLRQAFTGSVTVRVAKAKNIYRCGDQANTIYFIESGLIKLVMLSPEGKECLLAVLTEGDVFGELCLSGARARLETTTAMGETILRKISCHKFMGHLNTHSLFADFVSYLVLRIAEQENTITSLMTVDCQHRLGEILVQLADKIGKPMSNGVCIEHRITHEELSELVGTTRPRITEFLKAFRKLGLVEMNSTCCFMVKRQRLITYLKTR